MDFHLNSLLNLPNTTVFTCYKEAGFIFIHLQLTNEGINCPNCQSYTDTVHQTSHIFDNIHPQGISRVEWMNSFCSPIQDLGQDFQITETEF
jgi:hypothetical protein